LPKNALCSTGLMVITLLIFAQVINRYWLHFEVMWLSDFALYIFIVMMFLAIGLTTRENGHTSVEVFADKVFGKKPRGKRLYGVFLLSISLATVIVFGSPTLHFAGKAMTYPQYGTLVRWFNTSWLMESMLAMVLLAAYHLIFRIHLEAAAARAEKGSEGR